MKAALAIVADAVPHLRKTSPRAHAKHKNKPSKTAPAPRILFVTPEISYVSPKMGPGSEHIRAKAGGMADISATLVDQLLKQGADVHIAIPHYRDLFNGNSTSSTIYHDYIDDESRVHLAEDASFYHCVRAYYGDLHAASLAFQREVINHIIPLVKPDIVHCNDWMSGLIPAACKKLGIKTVFTIHNIHHEQTTLAAIEDCGIDASEFWEKLHYEDYPYSFEQSYHHNSIDMLSSAIINADYVTTVSPTFLQEIIHGAHGELPESVQWDLLAKIDAGYAKGIINSPDPSFSPADDDAIAQAYTAKTQHQSKAFNKVALQKKLGLTVNNEAPMLFWPSRLDPIQKGCQLLTEILYQIMHDYEDRGLQLVIVGDGPFQQHFHDIVGMHGLHHRVAVRDFDETLSRQAFAASDFVLMPSSFEPCGLPQMIGARYGTLPIVHNTGGLHDTVEHLSHDYNKGNGFVFDYYDSGGLRWAIDRAMDFHQLPGKTKTTTISRVMRETSRRFNKDSMFLPYFTAYTQLAEDYSSSAANSSCNF